MAEPENVVRIRIQLDGSDLPIWRRVEVPIGLSLKGLHDVIQTAMGWLDYHLWEFEIEGRSYGPQFHDEPNEGIADAKKVKLDRFVGRGVTEFGYIYDFGDGWEHTVTIEGRSLGEPDRLYPRFVEGERRCPPEDVGGILGFYEFIDALRDPKHERHEEFSEWYGRPFDADGIDLPDIQDHFDYLARRRAEGRANAAKRRRAG